MVNAYALTFGGLLLLGGRAGDILGRKRVFIAGIILFSVASLLGGFATSEAWLLAARALQGVGGAIVAPTALSLVTTNFPEGPPRNRAMGVYAAMSIGGAAVGLIAGGLLTTYLSWRWVLFVNVPIGVVVALLAPRAAGRVASATPRRFDLPGAITGTLGLAALVYGLSSAATSPNGVSHWGDTKVVASLAAAVVLLAAFLFIESRSKHALMPLRIFRNRNRSGAYLIMLCVGTAMFGMFFFLTIFVQTVWDYSALKTGVAYLPMVAMIMVMAGVSAQLVPRIGARPLLLAASAIASGGHVLAVADQRAQQLRRRPARPDAGHRGGPGHAVHAADPGRAVQGRGPGRGPGLQPGQYRPAGRRLDRAGHPGHRGLDGGGQHGPQLGGARQGGRRRRGQGRAPAAHADSRPSWPRPRRRSTTTRCRSASPAGSRCRRVIMFIGLIATIA